MVKSYQLGLYEKSMPGSLSLAEKLMETKTGGFDYLELSVDETDEKLARLEWTDGEINELRGAMEKTGVPILSMCLSGHRRFPLGDPQPAARGKSLAIMEKAIVLSVRLGIRIIQIAGYDVYYKPGNETTRNYFRENLYRSVEIAARHGVILAFETMETPFINTIEKAIYWVKEINSPYLQVYADIGNVTNAMLASGGDIIRDIESGTGHLAALHLKETKPNIYREVPYGEGHVDFAAAVKTAWKAGVRMYVGEFWYTGEENWRQNIASNNRYLRGFLENNGK